MMLLHRLRKDEEGQALVLAAIFGLVLALCILGVFPAFRIVSGILGPLRLLPEIGMLWVISIASIFGTILWCFFLGIVLLRRSFGSTAEPAVEPATR